jgi:hypothetical protein
MIVQRKRFCTVFPTLFSAGLLSAAVLQIPGAVIGLLAARVPEAS